MKFKYKNLKDLSILIISPILLLLGGCAEDLNSFNEGLIDEKGESLIVTLNFPDYIQEVIESRSFGSENIVVAFYDEAKQYLSQKTIDDFVVSEDKKTIVVTLSSNKTAKYVHFILNASLDTDGNPSNQIVTSPNENILWGFAELANLKTTPTLSLIHPVAKIRVTDEASDFSLAGYYLYGEYEKGYLAPQNWDMTYSNLNIPQPTPSRKSSPTDDNVFIIPNNDKDAIYAFETDNSSQNNKDKLRIIVKGTYKGNTYYYPVAFADRVKSQNNSNDYSEDPSTFESLDYLDIHRNHEYTFKIKYVREEGWKELSQAIAAEPDNRIAVEITDRNSNITDIIATRDYALGVEVPENVQAWNSNDATNGITTIQIEVVSTYPTYSSEEAKVTAEVYSEYASWLKLPGSNSLGVASPGNGFTDNGSASITTDGEVSRTGTKYLLNVQVYGQKNEDSREGKILIKSGKLSREITIIQNGFDFLNGDLRRVIVETTEQGVLISATDLNSDNYFEWLSQCKGIRPSENRGVIRNRGLHFPAVPAYKVKYKVPKEEGDKDALTIISEGSEDFSLDKTTDPSYYIIESKNTDAPAIKIGKFIIVDKDNIRITYSLYQTGFFHNMTSIISENSLNSIDDGWYYYEIVKVKSGQYIMDRNLGATSNAAYKTTYVSTRKNTNAIGGYFKISNSRFPNATKWHNHQNYESNVTIIDSENNGLNSDRATVVEGGSSNSPSMTYTGYGFRVPSQSEMENWGISVKEVPSDDDVPMVAGVGVTEKASDWTENVVYIPHSGYYDGNTPESEIYINLWTRNLHCYAQSFDAKESEDFGYWYRFLNGYGSTSNSKTIDNIGQIRMVSGGYGSGMSGEFRYMPIRLIWEGVGSSSDSGNEDDHKFTVYFDNINMKWTTPYIYYWKGSTNNGWPGKAMNEEGGHIWSYKIEEGMTDCLFNAGDGDNSKKGNFTLNKNHGYTENGDTGVDYYVIYYNNSSSNWNTPHIHYWGGVTSTDQSPPVAMKKVNGNIWQCGIPSNSNFIFCDGSGWNSQTRTFNKDELENRKEYSFEK